MSPKPYEVNKWCPLAKKIGTLMSNIYKALQEFLNLNPEFSYKIISSFVVLAVVLLTRLILLRVIFKQSQNEKVRYHWRKFSTYRANCKTPSNLIAVYLAHHFSPRNSEKVVTLLRNSLIFGKFRHTSPVEAYCISSYCQLQ